MKEEKNKNKKLFFLFGMIFMPPLLAVAVLFSGKCLAGSENLIITEIMYDPEGNNSDHSKWIEIYNISKKDILIEKSDFGIIDEKEPELGSDNIHYKGCHRLKNDIEIKSNSFIIIAENIDKFFLDYPSFEKDGKAVDSAFSLSSKENHIKLSFDDCETFFEKVTYDTDWGAKNNGRTLEKIDLDEKDSENNWQESYVLDGTPGEKNSKKPDPKDYAFKISINEIFPAPEKGRDEYIELFNHEKKEVDLSGWILKDASKSGKYVFPKDAKISARTYLVVYKEKFKFALNNSGDESVILVNPAGVEISRLNYKGSTASFSYSFDGENWRWTSRPTPGEENKFDKILTGEIRMDKKIYKDMYADFEVKTDKDVQKFTWDFGDSHKSYLEKTRHKYEKEGKYKASLRLRGNGEEKTYEFSIEVEKFKAPEIKIVALSPNPEGSDVENEWIKIENQSEKDVNLKNWSVATGWDNLYNHPIREDFKIKEGKTKELKRDICAFTLNNAKTKIELRDPTGKVAHKIKYDREENKISEDEIYEKVDEEWIWINPNPPKIESKKQVSVATENPPDPEEQIIIDPDLLGKYSPYSAWQNRFAYRIKLISYATNINMPSVTNEPLILGAETVKKSGNYYSFTALSYRKHWALKILEDLWIKINSFVNRRIN